MSQKVPIVVMASGRGSNFTAIYQAIEAGELSADIRALVCDQPEAPVLDLATEAQIPTIMVPVQSEIKDKEQRRIDHDERILHAISGLDARFMVLAGYMRVFSPLMIRAFDSGKGYSRIVNVHPSLLPAFKGLDGYRQAFQYGCQLAGVSIHLVDEKLDHGPICAQEAFSISSMKMVDEVEKRGLQIEHSLYPQTLQWVLAEEFDLDNGRRVCVRSN